MEHVESIQHTTRIRNVNERFYLSHLCMCTCMCWAFCMNPCWYSIYIHVACCEHNTRTCVRKREKDDIRIHKLVFGDGRQLLDYKFRCGECRMIVEHCFAKCYRAHVYKLNLIFWFAIDNKYDLAKMFFLNGSGSSFYGLVKSFSIWN